MSIKNHLSTKKMAAGALVALSGFVPQIASQPAFAASASISVTGSFVTGIALAAGNDVKFGKVATTAVNGKVGVSTAGAVAVTTNAIAAGGTPQAGSFTYTIVNTVPAIDVSVAGIGTFTFTGNSAGGVVKTGGPVSLKSIILDGIGTTAITLTPSIGGTKGLSAAYDVTGGTTGTLLVGANIAFTANPTIGSFAVPITLTIAY